MHDAVLKKLLGFIADNFQVEEGEINLENSLIDEGIIDSFGLIEIANFIDEEFGFTIKEDDMHFENFGSVTKIANFICRKIAIAENSHNLPSAAATPGA